MDSDGYEQPLSKKPKDFKAATHILKREALRRYRLKLKEQTVTAENVKSKEDTLSQPAKPNVYESSENESSNQKPTILSQDHGDISNIFHNSNLQDEKMLTSLSSSTERSIGLSRKHEFIASMDAEEEVKVSENEDDSPRKSRSEMAVDIATEDNESEKTGNGVLNKQQDSLIQESQLPQETSEDALKKSKHGETEENQTGSLQAEDTEHGTGIDSADAVVADDLKEETKDGNDNVDVADDLKEETKDGSDNVDVADDLKEETKDGSDNVDVADDLKEETKDGSDNVDVADDLKEETKDGSDNVDDPTEKRTSDIGDSEVFNVSQQGNNQSTDKAEDFDKLKEDTEFDVVNAEIVDDSNLLDAEADVLIDEVNVDEQDVVQSQNIDVVSEHLQENTSSSKDTIDSNTTTEGVDHTTSSEEVLQPQNETEVAKDGVDPEIANNAEPVVNDASKDDNNLIEEISYDSKEFQSIPNISKDSGIPLNILQFYHSFGYDCKKRSNLYMLRGPTALFAAGNCIHLLTLATDKHQFLRSCGGGGIGALAVHPSGDYFAVAEKGQKPGIYIYHFPSLSLHRILRGGTEKAYSFIDFNPKGDLLASVGSSPDYMLTVWDWKKEKIMLRSKAFSQEVYRVTFSPEQEGQLTSCGTTHIRFWKMAWTFTGLKLKGELGRFGKTSLGDIEGYIQLPDGKVLSGSDWGNMLLWDGGLIKVEISRKNQKPCHIGSIQQLIIDEGELITIGKDGYVRVWEMEAIDTADTTDESDIFEIEPMNELRVGADVQLTCMVKASQDEEGDDTSSIWYAQDANGGIWKLDLSFSHTTKPPEKLYSYSAGPITGVVCSPKSHLMAASGDSYVRVYDYLSKKLLCQYHTPTPQTIGTSIVWPNQVIDSKGSTILVGFSDGTVRVLSLQKVGPNNSLTLMQAWKPHSSRVTAMAFDNSGQTFATGSSDKTVFFFHVDDDQYDPIGFVKVPGEVTGLQWSPGGFAKSTLLVSCNNGKVVEVDSPSQSAIDTSHSYHLHDVRLKYFTFQSVKSELRRNEEKERKEKAKAERRAKREKELKRREEAGEEISPEDAQAFLNEDPEAPEESEEEPLYYPPEPSAVLQAFYLDPERFVVSMDGYDAGYLYECEFPNEQLSADDDVTTAPLSSYPVQDCNDEPITRMTFGGDRRKVIVGFKNGLLRVYPLDSDPDEIFSLDMLDSYWDLNMHDNDTGAISYLSESYDGAHLFSGGGDGNLFGYSSLAHEEIIKSMEGRKAKLPSPKRTPSEQEMVDDIDDPHAYSIEDAKLKAEQDKMIREAEAKKTLERKRITKLRKTFLELQRKNSDLPDRVQLKKEEFILDPTLRDNVIQETSERIERTRLEMQWDKAKLELAHNKLKKRFRAQLECDRVVVHSFQSSHSVASYRLDKLSESFHTLRGSISEMIRANSTSSEPDAAASDAMRKGSINSERPQDNQEHETTQLDAEAFIRDPSQKQKATILHGRQAEKVQKALQKAAEAREKREKRQNEWQDLYRNKPDENYEDPADVAAIREAQANMGDFKLKTAPDYVVPEHLRMDTEKKRFQILLLQGMAYQLKSEFNEKLIKLRDGKLSLVEEIRRNVSEVKRLQKMLPEEEQHPVPRVPEIHSDEKPHMKFEFTKESLLKFEEDEIKRSADAAMKKRTGDGGLFGGFGGDAAKTSTSSSELKLGSRNARKTTSVASSGRSKSSRMKVVEQEVATPTKFEMELSKIEKIRCVYHRDRLLDGIKKKITSFDAGLRLLRHVKGKLDTDLKMADLREVTLIEELLLLKEYEKREKALSGRVAAKKNELTEILGKAAETQVKFEAKRREIDRLTDRERAIEASFTNSVGENNKFADFLNRVFKKKIKRAKKKVAAEGDEDGSDVSSSDESDLSSDEDDDDSMEGGFDDSVCPPGCDPQLFESTIGLREKRLDLEESLVEERKAAETLKKEADSFSKKARVMEAQLKTALADLEAFQIEKQGKLNELDVVVPLRLHQVEHVYNGVVPNDLSSCLIFTNYSLTSLQRRIKELQQEKSEQRKLYKEARLQHVHLIKNRRVVEQRIHLLEEKCENMMMLKFGRVVDLDKLDSVAINKNVEELKEKVRISEMRNAEESSKRQRVLDQLKEEMTELVKENTKRLDTLNVLVSDKDSLEQSLEKRQKNMELDDPTMRKKTMMREQHRLVQLVQLQAQEIQALKEEIGLLSRKGGHILPPAQPPLGQDQDVI